MLQRKYSSGHEIRKIQTKTENNSNRKNGHNTFTRNALDEKVRTINRESMIDRKHQLEKLKVFSNLPDVFENNRTIKDTTIDIQFKRGTMAVSIIPDSYHHTYKKT